MTPVSLHASKRMPFRFHAKKVGLTYSCPVNAADNPIPDNDALKEHLENLVGIGRYIIAEEKHESGKRHYHVYYHADAKIDTTNALFFDFPVQDADPVHPNIINAPGNGWQDYCKKDKEFISNIKKNVWKAALELENADLAVEHLWANAPADMCKFGDRIAENVHKRMRTAPPEGKVWDGPYHESYYPKDWDHTTHSLLLWGPPGANKTQFAKYYLWQLTGVKPTYIKGGHEQLRHIDYSKPFIHDEVYLVDKDAHLSREITDVVDGGCLTARNKDINIPPGVPRIFISNYEHPFCNPQSAVYGRRVHSHAIPISPPGPL